MIQEAQAGAIPTIFHLTVNRTPGSRIGACGKSHEWLTAYTSSTRQAAPLNSEWGVPAIILPCLNRATHDPVDAVMARVDVESLASAG